MAEAPIYGFSLWAHQETKSGDIFASFVDLADSDASAQGFDAAPKIALIDDITPRNFLERSDADQEALNDRYRQQLLGAGFTDTVTASELPGVATTERTYEVLAAMNVTDFYKRLLPPYKRNDPDLTFAQVLMPTREIAMLHEGINERGINCLLFGPSARNFASWFQSSSLLTREVRVLHLPEKISD